jgi:ribosomal silencing factor RsfS
MLSKIRKLLLKIICVPYRTKREDGEWSVIDMGDILIHIMVEDYREKYNIEEFLEDFKNKSEEE